MSPTGMRLDFNRTPLTLSSGAELTLSGSLELSPGDRVLLYGENGAGKTTVLMAIASVLTRHVVGSTTAAIRGHIHRINWDRISFNGHRRSVPAQVFQEPRQNFICGASSDEIVLPLLTNSLTATEAIGRIRDLVDAADVYYRNLWRQRIDDLSSGEQQRIAVAAALAGDPAVILWDEALARVDAQSSTALRELMDGLFTDGILICATHRVRRYRQVLGGEAVGVAMVGRSGSEITIGPIRTGGAGQEDSEPEAPAINFALRPLWTEFIGNQDVAVSLFKNGMRLFSGGQGITLELSDLEFLKRDHREPLAVLQSGVIRPGLNFLVGRNGSGKTLFMRLLCGQIPLNPLLRSPGVAAQGSVRRNELGAFRSVRSGGLSVYLPAEPFRWLTQSTVEEEIGLCHSDGALSRRIELLEACGVSRESVIDYLSYGQQKMVALMAVPERCELVCLDEPFADLGLPYIERAEAFIASQIRSECWRCVLISHSSDIDLSATTRL